MTQQRKRAAALEMGSVGSCLRPAARLLGLQSICCTSCTLFRQLQALLSQEPELWEGDAQSEGFIARRTRPGWLFAALQTKW